MSDQNTAELTIGQLFALNQGKNPKQIADTEARARQSAQELGLDYEKLAQTPEGIVEAADAVSAEKRVRDAVLSDPVLGQYYANPKQAALAIDDTQKLSTLSKTTSVFGSGLSIRNQTVTQDDVLNVVKNAATPEQIAVLEKNGWYEAPNKAPKPTAPKTVLDTLNQNILPQKTRYKGDFMQFKQTSNSTLPVLETTDPTWQASLPEPSAPRALLNATARGGANLIDSVAEFALTQNQKLQNLQQTNSALGVAFNVATKGVFSGIADPIAQEALDFSQRVRQNAPMTQAQSSAMLEAQVAASKQDGGINKTIAAAKSFGNNATPTVVAEFALEQIPPALIGFFLGSKGAGAVGNMLTRNVAKYAPAVMSMERAAALTKASGFATAVAQGAVGAGTADALVSYGQNMAQAREKFLTREEQIDYAAAKTWGSAKYSALGGAFLPVTFGGPLRTVFAQAAIQGVTGIQSVRGSAAAVGEQADPVEMALEGLFGAVTAIPEVALVAGEKVRNKNTTAYALDQIYKEQQNVSVKSNLFAAILKNLVAQTKESETYKRDEFAAQTFLRTALEQHGAISEVYVDGQTFNQTMRDSGVDPEDIFSKAPSIQEQLGNAAEFDGSIRIPVDEFVLAMAQLDDATPFIEQTRAAPDMPTLKEVQENLAKTTEQMRAEAEVFAAEQSKFENADDAKQFVADNVEQQLKTTAKFGAKYNKAVGELASAFYSTLGEKLGMNAQQAFEQYPIRIMDNLEGQASYNQALRTEASAPFFKAIDDVVAGKTPDKPFNLGTTPDVLKLVGMPDSKIVMNGATIEKVMAQYLGKDKGSHTNIHNLSPDTLRKLPEQINNPIAVFKSGRNATQQGFVVLTELFEQDAKTGANKPVVAALHLNKTNRGLEVVRIASVYGRSKTQVEKSLNNDLLYWNKEKGQQFLTTLKLQLPQGSLSDVDLLQRNIKTDDDLKSIQGWNLRPDANIEANDSNAATQLKADSSDLELGAGIDRLSQQGTTYNQNGTRGSIVFPTGQDGSIIVLPKNADFSTFVHELGHHFLEMSMQLALKDSAPDQVRKDMETVLKWAKTDATDLGEWDFFTDAEKTEVHEKFAESFEQYIFTGKAPSLELRYVFSRLRQFMIAVYRNIEKFLGINDRAELNSEITGVMDRMLSSTAAIQEAEAANSIEMLIKQEDALRLGISPKDYDEMRQDYALQTEVAINNLEQKSFKNMVWYQKTRTKYLRTLQREANAKRMAVREKIAEDVAQEPIYRAMAFLSQPLEPVVKTDPKTVDPERDNLFQAIAKLGGLDATEIESTWGVDKPAQIKSGVGNKPVSRSARSKQSGLSIEEMAERLADRGYLSIDENGKFDSREFEDKFSEQLIGNTQYSNQADGDFLQSMQDMDLLQKYAEGLTTKAKLSLDWIEAKYGAESLVFQQISKGAYGFAQRGGENPDMVAELLGFESGDALIRELLDAPTAKQRIDDLTDQTMAAQYSEFFDEQSIVEAVESALHNDVRQKVLAAEVAALNGLMGRRSDLNAAAKAIAKDMVNRQKLRDIRPHARAQDSLRLARLKITAFKKGDTLEAAKHGRNQLVQSHATKYSYDAKAQVDKSLELVKTIFGNNEKLAKSRDFDMVTAARGVLAKYGLGRESSGYEQQLELIRQYDPTTYAELQNIGVLPENADYRDLTFEQFQAVMGAVEMLWHRSRENKKWYTTNEALEREEVRAQLIQQSSGKRSIEKLNQTLLGNDLNAELRAYGLTFMANMKRVDQVVTWLDGGASGKYHDYIVNPIQDALAQYRIAKTQMLDDVVKTFDGFGKIDNTKIAAPELNNMHFKGKQALLHAILHTGTQSNKERLILGYGWGERLEDGSVDFSKWDKFIARMFNQGVISKSDMDTVQQMWNLFDRYKVQAQITHKKINGRYFDELEASPVSTPWGDYAGGYVPATYDRLRSNEQDRIQEKSLAENNLQAMDIATTGASFTKSRAARYSDKLELDLSKLPAALDKELRYIHLELQIRQVGRLFLNKDFRNEIERVLPFASKNIFTPWLKSIADQTAEPKENLNLFDKTFAALRRNTGIAIMAGNLKNAIETLTGFSQVAVVVPPKLLFSAQAEFFKSVATRSDMANQIMELSDFMQTRWDRAADENRYAIEKMVLNKNKLQTTRDFFIKHAYILQSVVQKPMEVISWQAAFNHYTAQGLTQYDAVRAADAVIRQYMTDMSPEGISNLERGSPAKRMFLMFYNYFNMVWNTASSETRLALEVNNGSWLKASPRLAYVSLMMVSVPALLSELLGILFAGGIDDGDDDGEKWDDLSGQLALSQVKMLSAFVPYGGNVINAGIGNTDSNPMNDRYTASPVFSIGQSSLSLVQHANRAIDNEKDVNLSRAAKDILNSATLATGVPFAALGRPTGYWLQVAEGKADTPETTLDAVRGTVSGKPTPE